jgi:hypothetical protein
MKVRVTRQDIRKGVKESQDSCPVARAIKRITHKKVYVDPDSIIVYYRRDQSTFYDTTSEVTDFIELFDDGGKVSPFTFELGLPV